MKPLSTLSLHHVAIATGAFAIAAGTNFVVMDHGGWFTRNALVSAALGMAVFVGALVINKAWRSAFWPAVAMLCGIVASEAYNLTTTAETTMVARAHMVAPLQKQARDRADAVKALADIERSEPTSPRLTLAKAAAVDAKSATETLRVKVAKAAVAKAQDDVEAEAKNVRCRAECERKQQLANAAARELTAALSAAAEEHAGRIANADREVQSALVEAVALHAAAVSAAKASVNANPEPAVSATLLADKLGVADWALELMIASLRSIAINLAAAALVAYGATGLKDQDEADDLEKLRTMFAGPVADTAKGPKVEKVTGQRGGQSGNGGQSGGQTPNRPKKPGPSGGQTSKSDAFDYVMQLMADGRTIGSNQELADAWNRPKTTVSDWMKEWREAGVVPAGSMVGRCKATIPA